MNAEQEIHALTQRLNLKDARQDWGIVNSDPSRVGEWIENCEKVQLTPYQQFAMGELVFASMNDALVEGVADDGLIEQFERFLGFGLQGLASQVNYWSSLDNEEEFPIARLLRRLSTQVS